MILPQPRHTPYVLLTFLQFCAIITTSNPKTCTLRILFDHLRRDFSSCARHQKKEVAAMAKKKKEKIPYVKTVWMFVGKTPHQELDRNKLWIVTDRIHGGIVPHCRLSYNYDPRLHRLTVFNMKGEKIFDREAYYGPAFEIKDPQKPRARVTLLRYPHGKENAIPWLCGFYNPALRTDDKQKFREIRHERRGELGLNWMSQGQNHRGKSHRFASVNIEGTNHLIAAYATSNMDKPEIKQILADCQDQRFPDEFVRNVLYTQADFQKGDFNIAMV